MTDQSATNKEALVHYRDETQEVSCPYGTVERIMTGGQGGIANVHVVTVSEGGSHFHAAYDEVYYVLSGQGQIRLGEKEHPLRPGAVVTIPSGLVHSLVAEPGSMLEFIIFGTPAMSVEDPAARPQKPAS